MADSQCKIIMTKYSIGDLVHHKLFDYRGAVIDIDPYFQLPEEWYVAVARSRPPKDQPWYHVIVNDSTKLTYVAEQNLEVDPSGNKINHPMVKKLFTDLQNGHYMNANKAN
ncbi:MAG: DNA-binding protein [Moritella sp.]|uniref:heat shock protein HspQ n=1 Tax=unclassified Moritella TaxID=2637987 RepID=UPI0001569259|nr:MULTISPECIES: heat shock protein HspQ [unclassified Moritella]EDM66823.1 Hemimethylated DNA-binding region [Moritella sp. PE36]MBL1415891.1 heat shock protein HspQ [Moritella sp.]PHR85998.1 MAG: DNA-binding protein [Moritella sp.]